jgi:hypothetical protein
MGSPEFPQHVVADYTDQSLLKSEISSIYVRQHIEPPKKKSTYLEKRNKAQPSRESAREKPKQKLSRNSSRDKH